MITFVCKVNESDDESFLIQGYSKNQKEFNEFLKKQLQDNKPWRMSLKTLYEEHKNDKKFKKGIPSSWYKDFLNSIVVFKSTVPPTEEPETVFENKQQDQKLLKTNFIHHKDVKALYKKSVDSVEFLNRDKKKCDEIMKEIAGSNFYDDNHEKKVRKCSTCSFVYFDIN